MTVVFAWSEVMAGEGGIGLLQLTLAHYATCSGAFRFLQPFTFLPASLDVEISRLVLFSAHWLYSLDSLNLVVLAWLEQILRS